MRKAIIQLATGQHAELLDITAHHHNRYANRHGMEYHSFRELPRPDLPASWSRLDLMIQFFRRGFDVVVWMDSDAVVDDPSQDISRACRHGVGMVRYDQPFCHYQAGVIVAHRAPEVEEMLRDVLDESRKNHFDAPGKYGVWEQTPMNVIGVDRGLISSIHCRWNFVPMYAQMEGPPAVYAYHGYQPFSLRRDLVDSHVRRQAARSTS